MVKKLLNNILLKIREITKMIYVEEVKK